MLSLTVNIEGRYVKVCPIGAVVLSSDMDPAKQPRLSLAAPGKKWKL